MTNFLNSLSFSRDNISSFEKKLSLFNISIKKINLENKSLSGEIPDSISKFINLRILYLHNNHLSGKIPSSISKLSNLKELALGNNNLSGEIPDSISCLRNLQELWLYENKFSGNIPFSLSYLTNLLYLSLSENELTGEIPDFLSCLTNLQRLALSNNKFSGQIPDSISCLTNLQRLWLYKNNLTGEIPDSISCLTNLQKLNFYKNNLSGEIPSCISCLTNLQELDLSDNKLSGDIPNSMSHLLKLEKLDLNNNKLEKTPTSIDSLHKIIEDKLYNQSIKGNRWDCLKNEDIWKKQDIDIIHFFENIISNSNKIPRDLNDLSYIKQYLQIHDIGLYDWKRVFNYLNIKYKNITELKNIKSNKLDTLKKEKQDIIKKKLELENELELLEQKEIQITQETDNINKFLEKVLIPLNIIGNIGSITEEITNNNKKLNDKVNNVLEESNNLNTNISEEDLMILFEKMNLIQYYKISVDNFWDDNILNINENDCDKINMKCRDKCCFLYNIEMMKSCNYTNEIKEDECLICEHNTPIKTIELLEEYNIKFNKYIILVDNWITPYLLYLKDYTEIGIKQIQYKKVNNILKEWKQIHEKHLTNQLLK